MRFKDKVAIVTGGAGAIGQAVIKLFLREGANVLIADQSEKGESLARSFRDAGYDVVFCKTDVSKEHDIARMMETALQRWNRLDIMVANAGIGGRGKADETTAETWHRVLDINLTGIFFCTKYAVPAMRQNHGGAIINTASIMAIVATEGVVPYATTKGALINLTRSTAIDYAAENIRINAVCPGHLEEPTAVGGAAARAFSRQELLAQYPMGRLAKPEDVANAIAFLASEEAAFITGTALIVDGGYTAK